MLSINHLTGFGGLSKSYQTTAWSWGRGSAASLGDGTLIDRSSPVSVVGGFTDWRQVDAGYSSTLGVRSNGTAWGWGPNYVFLSGSPGSIGDGTTLGRSSPVLIVGGFTDWCQVSAGTTHGLGLRSNGTVWAWGYNGGILGDGTTIKRSSPVSVVGGFTDWRQVSAGGSFNLGLRSNGTAWAWGSGYCGKLGDNTTVNRSSPVSVVGGFTDWSQLSAGGNHSLGLRSNGTIWSWGQNVFGQLGDTSLTTRTSPVSVVGGFTDWCQISAGDNHSLGLRSNGTVWAWGNNPKGQLGDGTVASKASPVSVVGGFTDWCQVSAGYHSMGIRSNGTAWTWGYNICGELGDGTRTNRNSPVSVVGGFTDWCYVNAATGNQASHGIRKTEI